MSVFLRMKPSFINPEGHIGTVFDVGHQIETVIRGRFCFLFDCSRRVHPGKIHILRLM